MELRGYSGASGNDRTLWGEVQVDPRGLRHEEVTALARAFKPDAATRLDAEAQGLARAESALPGPDGMWLVRGNRSEL